MWRIVVVVVAVVLGFARGGHAQCPGGVCGTPPSGQPPFSGSYYDPIYRGSAYVPIYTGASGYVLCPCFEVPTLPQYQYAPSYAPSYYVPQAGVREYRQPIYSRASRGFSIQRHAYR